MKFSGLPKRKTDVARTPNTLARHLFSSYERFRIERIGPHNCNHAEVSREIQSIAARNKGLFKVEEIGKSLEGRSINLVSCGKGAKRILLWSQMHGDEYTATLALIDVFNRIAGNTEEEYWMREMLEDTRLLFIPMLNPDGAELRQRRTVQAIDMNRDALALATPEAKLLKSVQQKLKPQFGFNLHDQELARAGETGDVTAIALLAPPLDRKRSTPMVRVRAIRVGALIARVLGQFIPRNLATYPDGFEPRAFGDNIQSWGTSTLLIESGHWKNDKEKKFIRKLNFVGLLTALRCIGNGSYQDAELDLYHHLPENNKSIYDIIIRDVVLEHNGWSHAVDIGLTIPVNTNPNPVVVTVKDIGDLSTFIALETIAGQKRKISSGLLKLEQSMPLATLLDELQLYNG